MKSLSYVAGALGVIFALLALYGRFHGAPSIWLMGHTFAASTFLLVANTLLLIGIFLALLARSESKPTA